MTNHPHPLANCPLCSATRAMGDPCARCGYRGAHDCYVMTFGPTWDPLQYDAFAVYEHTFGPRATTRDPFRFSTDDVIDVHQALEGDVSLSSLGLS